VRISEALRLLNAGPILRRYFFINAFDGAITALGVLLSAYLVGLRSALEVALPVLGVGVSMFAAGFLGTFFTELAERTREIQEMRDALLESMEETYYSQALKIVSIVIGIVDGISPLVSSTVGLIPLLIGHYLHRSFDFSFFVSLIVVFLEIFILGIGLGRVSGRNPIAYGLQMLLIGFLTGILILLLAKTFGVTPV